MSKDRKTPPPPPPAAAEAPAPAAAEPKVDKHFIDDLTRPYIEGFVGHVLKFFSDHRAVDTFIRHLGPVTRTSLKALPGAVALAVRKIPDAWFKGPEFADFTRDIIVEASRKVVEIIDEKQGAGIQDFEKAVKEAEQAAMSRDLVVDPLGHVHVPECVRLSVFRRPAVNQQPPRYQNQNQQQPQPQQQPRQDGLTDIKLKDVIAQRLKISPCCANQVQEAISKASPAAPKSAKKNRSPLEIIGSITDEGSRNQFRDWLSGLPAEERVRAMHALQELDSEEEFMGFMSMDPAVRLEILPLLENRNGSHAIRKFFGITGAFLKNGWNMAADHYTKWNASLVPELERLRKKYHDEKGNVIPYKKPSWGQTLKAIFSLSPF